MFKAELKENTVYKIQQFMLTGQIIEHRMAEHLYRIRLAKNTKIIEGSLCGICLDTVGLPHV